MVYIVVIIGLLILSYFYDWRRAVNGRILSLVLVWLAFILIGGLRYRIGTDTVTYMYDFSQIPPLNRLSESYFSTTRFAVGYVVLTSFIKMLTHEFVAVQLVHAVLLSSAVVWFMYRNTRNVFFGLLLYFCMCFPVLAFQQMRESFAVAFFLFAWPAFRDRKWIRWYAFSCVAILFHLSASVMFVLPLFLIPGIRNIFVFGKKTWIFGLSVLALGIIVQAVFFRYIEMIAVTQAVADRAAVYSSSKMAVGIWNTSGWSGALYALMKCVIYPMFAFVCLRKFYRQFAGRLPENLRKMEFMVLMSMYIGLFSFGIVIWARYNNYFYFFPIAVIADWMYSHVTLWGKWIRLKFMYWWVLIMPLLVGCFYQYTGNVNKSGTLRLYTLYYPYSSWLDQERDKDRENSFRYLRPLYIRR